MSGAVNAQQNIDNNRSGRSLYISLFCFLSVFFIGMLIVRGVPVYSDSEQYISMHVHREPIYPLFLWTTRVIAGDNSLLLAGIIQSILAICASYKFVVYILKKICFLYVRDRVLVRWFVAVILTVTVIVPYIITPLMSVTHVMLASGILSESLAMPLFLLYMVRVHKMLVDRNSDGDIKYEHIIVSLILAFVLSLIRSQMIVTMIAWMILAKIAILVNHNENIRDVNNGRKTKSSCLQKTLRVLVVLLVFVICMPLRIILTKSYNQVFNDRYVNNVYTNLTMLTNVFYATDRESGELIEDEDLRGIFYRLYDVMDENEWSYKYAGDSVVDRAIYLEEVHDRVKFDVLEAGFRDILNERGMEDYIDYNHKAEEYCAELIKILRPQCLIKWFEDWIIMGCRGVVRSIAVCHPVMYAYSLLAILYIVIGIMICRKRDKSVAFLAIISLLYLMGNAFGTAYTIMCLSRYMIYAFAPFYCSVIALTLCFISNHKQRRSGVVTP